MRSADLPRDLRRPATLLRRHLPKVPSLPHRPRQSIDSQAVDMWTTLKKRSPHAHSHNKCKCQARSDINQDAAVRFTSIRHITHIRRAPPTDSPEEPKKKTAFPVTIRNMRIFWCFGIWKRNARTAPPDSPPPRRSLQ